MGQDQVVSVLECLAMRCLALIVFTGILAGCTNQLAVREAELNQWIGRPESQLLTAMGVPDRTYETNGMKFLAYSEHRVEWLPGTPYPYGPPPFGWYAGGLPPQAIALSCDTTFAISDGLVRSYSLRGNACG
jgi:hypothetical protein